MGLPPAARTTDSPSDDEVDSEAVTVRTPNLPPIVSDEEAPFPLVSARSARAPGSTLRMQALSLRAPVSKAHESAWFEKESAFFVAPGVREIAEPLDPRHGLVVPSSRRVGFLMVSLLLAGVVAAGSYFFLTGRTDEAKVPDQASTTQITNAEALPPVIASALAPVPETWPVVKTVRTSDLPEARVDHRKVTTPTTEPNLRPDDTTIPAPSTDSPTTPPDVEEKR